MCWLKFFMKFEKASSTISLSIFLWLRLSYLILRIHIGVLDGFPEVSGAQFTFLHFLFLSVLQIRPFLLVYLKVHWFFLLASSYQICFYTPLINFSFQSYAIPVFSCSYHLVYFIPLILLIFPLRRNYHQTFL